MKRPFFSPTALLCVLVFAGILIAAAPSTKPTSHKDHARPHADLAILGARVVTMAAKQPTAEAVAIVGDRIAAVGTTASIRRWIGPNTRVIQAKGKMVLPGLIEAHGHLLGLGRLKSQLNLMGTKGPGQIAAMVRRRIASSAKGAWIVGRGWDQNDWKVKRFPTHQMLDASSPNNPVYLRRVDGHAAWVNQRALQLAGITSRTKAPKGGQIIRDAKGKPTGVLIDRAMALVWRHLPPPSPKQDRRALAEAIKTSLAHGITSFHDAGTSSRVLGLLKDLLRKQRLDLRVYAMLMGSDKKLIARWFRRGPEIGLGHHFLTIRSIKLLADGALGSRGAAMGEPYADKHGHKGLLMYDERQLTAFARRALKHGFQLAVHAIGDQANHAVLNAYQKAMAALPWKRTPRLRVEHAQILRASDIPRFAKLGVIPSMQPTHCTSDMPWVHKRIGTRRAQAGAYVWQSLLRTGARIAAGSDAPVESINPFWGLYAAITRQDPKGQPKGGWYPKQRMSRRQALRAFTLDAAYAAFEEKLKGSIEIGKLADLIAIDRDIFKVSARKLRDTKVVMTIVGGAIKYKATQPTR